MPDRVRYPTSIEDQVAQLRRTLEAAREVLKQPPPDTFLGRKSAEPFPLPEEVEHIEGLLNSKELKSPE